MKMLQYSLLCNITAVFYSLACYSYRGGFRVWKGGVHLAEKLKTKKKKKKKEKVTATMATFYQMYIYYKVYKDPYS